MNDLQLKLDYQFKNKNLLQTALTHTSYSNEFGGDNYDRLEFLGDAILELVVSEFIFKHTTLNSGDASKLRASLVSTNNLSNISKKLSLDKLILKSKSLNSLSSKTCADLFESVIGAIFLDGGIKNVKKVIKNFVIISKENIINVFKNTIDYKTKLQEDMQKHSKQFEYKLVCEYGKDHNKTFEVELIIDGQTQSRGIGKSIHLAQENSAYNFYNNLKD